MPERILAIPLNNNPSESIIIIITIAKPGYANRMDAKPTAIAPRIIKMNVVIVTVKLNYIVPNPIWSNIF